MNEKKEEKIIIKKLLKDQVYEYLRDQIHQQNLKPGSFINIQNTSKKLGISKTPLRDALLQLEMEGFVTLVPFQGIYINKLTLTDIRNFYHVIGALECSALTTAKDRFKDSDIKKMKNLNEEMKQALDKNNFDLFYEKNLEFHNTYINLSLNETLIKIVSNLKKRLYDFPRQKKWIKEWEKDSIVGHQHLIELIEKGKIEQAVKHIQKVVWSYEYHEKYIKMYYFGET